MRPLPRRAALAVLAAVWLAPRAAGLPPAGDEWIELRTENFRLLSNAGQRKAAEIGLHLERFRQVLARLKPGLKLSAPVPVEILAFRSERAFAPYKQRRGGGGEDLLGFFLSHPHGNYLALNANPRGSDPLPVVYHEYVHFFVRHNLPRLPLWANEGLAEYYSTFSELAGEVQIGAPIAPHVAFLYGRSFIPFERFFAIDRQSPEYNEGEKKGAYYAQCWALVHYLLGGDEERRRSSAVFLRLLGEGQPAEPALHEAFGIGLGELESRLRGYLRARTFLLASIPLGDLPAPTGYQVRPLARQAVLCHLGGLLAHGGNEPERLTQAEAHFRAALELDPAHPEAHAGLAFLAREAGRLAEAEALLRRAVELGTESSQTLVLFADVLLDRLQAEGGAVGSPLWREARAALERALALDPHFAEADLLLGLTYFFDPGDVRPGIGRLRKARAVLPDRPEIAFNLAMLLLKAGEVEAARGLIEGDLSRAGRDDLLAAGREAVERTRLVGAVNEAAEAGDEERAVALLREALAATSEPALAASMAEQLREAEAQLETNRLIGRYNRAVELANQGSLAEALAELEGLLAETPEGDLRAAARALSDELAQLLP